MKTLIDRKILALAALGVVGGTVSVANASGVLADTAVINISGATLFENFFRSAASTNDYYDADGNGRARILGSSPLQIRLAPFVDPINIKTPGFTPPAWIVQYRATGSGNGLAEFVEWAQTAATDFADLNQAENAYYNGVKYTDEEDGFLSLANLTNPGGAPARSTLNADRDATFNGTGGIIMDLAVLDVPVSWFVTSGVVANGMPNNTPGLNGYGLNPNKSVDPVTGETDSANAGQSNNLKSLGSLVLFDPANPPMPGATNVVFDTPIAFVPITPIVNLGTGVQELTVTELRYMMVSGRDQNGINYHVATRDSGSGTRNGFVSSLGLDPAWGVGDNVGKKTTLNENTLAGPYWYPTNLGGSGTMETTVRNNRFAIGYTGAERGLNRWLGAGQLEMAAVKNDTIGGTEYSRADLFNVLNNDVNGYVIGGPETFASLGDPLAEPVPATLAGMPIASIFNSGNPAMANKAAAAYLNNIVTSIAAFTGDPGQNETEFTPGELLALNFTLIAATDNAQSLLDPDMIVPNPLLNQDLQDYLIGLATDGNPGNDPLLARAAYQTFGTVTTTGVYPTRFTGDADAGLPAVPYTDQYLLDGLGQTTGAGFVNEAGSFIAYGGACDERNGRAGDFNGDGVRSNADINDMIAAWTERNTMGATDWVDPNVGGLTGSAIIEVLGDFSGDGNFDAADIRYWADGVAVDTDGTLDRAIGFQLVDDAFGGNFFGTTLATGAMYQNGDSVADIAGALGTAKGFRPLGADGVVGAADLDYAYANFGEWANFDDAARIDLTADVNGDMVVNQDDVCAILDILGTTSGDVDLDGVVSGMDRMIAEQTIADLAAMVEVSIGWATGDVNGDGTVDQLDLDIIDGITDPCAKAVECPGDATGDGNVDLADLNLILGNFGAMTTTGDVTGDGNVDLADLNLVLGNFGTSCN